MSKGPGRWANRVIGVSILLIVGLLLSQTVNSYFFPSKAVMHLGGSRFEVRLADDHKTRVKGLSGTTDLPADQAMVFIFDYNNEWSIWMKDMNYPIDIVWLDDSRTVVDFVTNVPPDSYPNRTFKPEVSSRYVVELRSGTVERKNIQVGQQAVFSGTSKEL